MEDYFKLYLHAVKAIKEVDGRIPADFISTHQYPTDEPLWKNEVRLEDFYANGLSGYEEMMKTYRYTRGVMKEMALKSR